jgi:hypothetical protein
MFLPSEQMGVYNFWIYVCPDDATFSSRKAVATLRDVASRGVKPWGTITLSEEPLLETAVASIIREDTDLPTKVSHQAFKIMIENLSTTRLHQMYVQSCQNTKEHYESTIREPA